MQITEYLYVPLATWAIAQGVKFLIAMFKGSYKPSLLFSSGGMPSVHSATVSSLATVALIQGGFNSPLFGIAGIFAAIVMYDSLGVRRSAGEQAKTLNHLIDDLMKGGVIKTKGAYGHLKEILGHRPLEVMIGAVMGVTLACLFLYQTVLLDAPWLLNRPSKTAMIIELILAIVLIIVPAIVWLVARKSTKPIRKFKPFLTQMFLSNIVVALLFGAILVFQNQKLSPWDSWIYVVVVLYIFFAWHLGLWYSLLIDGHLVDNSLEAPSDTRRKAWLKRAGHKSVSKSKKS